MLLRRLKYHLICILKDRIPTLCSVFQTLFIWWLIQIMLFFYIQTMKFKLSFHRKVILRRWYHNWSSIWCFLLVPRRLELIRPFICWPRWSFILSILILWLICYLRVELLDLGIDGSLGFELLNLFSLEVRIAIIWLVLIILVKLLVRRWWVVLIMHIYIQL